MVKISEEKQSDGNHEDTGLENELAGDGDCEVEWQQLMGQDIQMQVGVSSELSPVTEWTCCGLFNLLFYYTAGADY